MKKIITLSAALMLFTACLAQKTEDAVNKDEIKRLISTLASDEMQGRGTFTPGIEKAADFISGEFRKAGLQPFTGEPGFRQTFMVTRITPVTAKVIIDGKTADADKVLIYSDKEQLQWSNTSEAKVLNIAAGEPFVQKYQAAISSATPVLVLVDASHADYFKRLQNYLGRGRIIDKPGTSGGAVFVLGFNSASSYTVNASNKLETLPLSNVAAMIPGRSRPKELVLFSAHYDHLGIVKSVEGDSIANGADDDASGTTAVIALASHYKKLNNNERTLVFVAFTAEEIGGFGSKYFSSRLNPDSVMAMFNIEMIGKDSKFGANTAFITGYERSDFGEILQRNLEGTDFKFHPDPYPDQNLFYRSDNATLAALGVPAHTISTVQIDGDKFYHTVKDELETLDVNNITATIKAITLSARSIISGKDTPRRIPKLNTGR